MSNSNSDYFRAKYEDSLLALAKCMQHCAEMAEALAHANAMDAQTLPNGKSKGKGKAPPPSLEDGTGKRKRPKKDPNAPKRPASSFIIFQNEVRGGVKAAHPTLSVGDLRTLIANQWAGLPEEQKSHYKRLAEEAKENYTHEKAAYIARSPEEVAAANATPAPAKKSRKVKSAAEVDSEPERPALAVKKPAVKAKPALAPVPAKAATPSSSVTDSEEDSDEEEEDEKPKPKQAVKGSAQQDEDDDDEEEDDDEEADSDEEEEEEEPPVPAKKQKTKHEKPESKKTRK